MDSPMERSRSGLGTDFRGAEAFGGARLSGPARLVEAGYPLPVQKDRQVDSFQAPLPQAAGSSITFPFQITDATTVLGTPKIAVNYGTMQDMVPTGLSGSIAVGTAGNWNVYLDTTIDINGVVTAVAGSVTQSAMPSNTSYDGYILLGQLTVTSVAGNLVITAINQAATHSLRCGIAGRMVVSGVLTAPGTFEFWGF